MTDPRYPIGPFITPESYDDALRQRFIGDIETLPELVNKAVAGWTDAQLDTSYREGGWSIRQVLHHLPDSHLNAYVRFKLALTEDTPVIKPYMEERWAALPDSRGPVQASLQLLEGLHRRWTELLKTLSAEDFQRSFFHPESQRTFNLDRTLALYSWHSRHHLGHILIVKDQIEA